MSKPVILAVDDDHRAHRASAQTVDGFETEFEIQIRFPRFDASLAFDLFEHTPRAANVINAIATAMPTPKATTVNRLRRCGADGGSGNDANAATLQLAVEF